MFGRRVNRVTSVANFPAKRAAKNVTRISNASDPHSLFLVRDFGPLLYSLLWCVGSFFYFISFFGLRLMVPSALSLVIVKHFHHIARRMHVIQTDSSVGVCFNSSALVIFLWLLTLGTADTRSPHTFCTDLIHKLWAGFKGFGSNADALCTLANWLHCIRSKLHWLWSINGEYRLGQCLSLYHGYEIE